MKFKSLLAAAVICCMTQVAHAETLGIAIIKADGTQQSIAFSGLERIDIGDTTVTVRRDAGDAETYDMADIERIDIGTPASGLVGISNLIADGDIAVWPTVATETVNIAGTLPGSEVKLFDPDGRCLVSIKADTAGEAIVGVAGLTPGGYLVTIANHSVKIIKK